jgi:hypothetical protein
VQFREESQEPEKSLATRRRRTTTINNSEKMEPK